MINNHNPYIVPKITSPRKSVNNSEAELNAPSTNDDHLFLGLFFSIDSLI